MTLLLIRLLMLTLLFGTPVYGVLAGPQRTGKIRHTDSRRYCSRQQNPLGYWALVLLFATFAGSVCTAMGDLSQVCWGCKN